MTSSTAEFLDLQAALAGEYSLQRELGRGGMGIVYLARDVQLDRDVAIKTLPAHLARTAAVRERFLREARTAAGLSHPHIVPIHRVGEANGFVYFVMGYVEGETLGERLRTRGPLSPADATRVLREVAWALAYAHGRGIVHRDIKPDNILLEAATGRALVTDFGIAHAGVDSSSADAGLLMGTMHFMSPEQAANQVVDGRSDLYALGVVGHLAVSGRLPTDTINRSDHPVPHAAAKRTGVMRTAPGLPPALAAAIDRCLSRDPDARFADGEALAAALAPSSDARPALPASLRAWLATRNPLLVPYLAWSGLFGTMTVVNLAVWITGNRPAGPGDIVLLGGIASLPLLPIVGFHLHQARRQFRAGHTLADLRAALEIARRERMETDAVTNEDELSPARRVLRLATITAAGWLATTFGLVLGGVIHENGGGPRIFGVTLSMLLVLAPVGTTMLLGAISNALDIPFIPAGIRERWKTGIRDRLWNGRMGQWLARRFGAPEQSRAVGGGVFRATEAALGLAAGELFAALPQAHRAGLEELPAIVTSLEARAAAARAELDVVDALVTRESDGGDVLARRRAAASAQLAASVAALEGIRLDLLRLHAGASDLAPLTTLLDAARVVSEDVNRLADAQRDVSDVVSRRPRDVDRIPTPV